MYAPLFLSFLLCPLRALRRTTCQLARPDGLDVLPDLHESDPRTCYDPVLPWVPEATEQGQI